jgi:AcrR family transcriptional regulator
MMTTDKYDFLLNSARDLFTSSGIKGVSIDELSRKAGISKKTFYMYFINKNDLVLKVIQNVISELTAESLINKKRSENAVHEIILLANVYKKLASFKFLFNRYTLRAYPDVMIVLNDFKDNFLKDQLEMNLEKGISSGLYRPEINIKQTALIYLQLVCMFFCHAACTLETILAANNLYLNGIVKPTARAMVTQFDKK